MPANIAGNFSAAGGVAHVNCVFQVKLFGECGEIVSVGVHLVAIPSLGGAAVAAAVMRDDSMTVLAEKQHLPVPVVGAERPAVAEHDWLSCTPVLVVDLCAVFCRNRSHNMISLRVRFVKFAVEAGACGVPGDCPVFAVKYTPGWRDSGKGGGGRSRVRACREGTSVPGRRSSRDRRRLCTAWFHRGR